MHIVKNTCSKLMFFHIMAYPHTLYMAAPLIYLSSARGLPMYTIHDACTVYLCVTQHSQSDINGKGQKYTVLFDLYKLCIENVQKSI